MASRPIIGLLYPKEPVREVVQCLHHTIPSTLGGPASVKSHPNRRTSDGVYYVCPVMLFFRYVSLSRGGTCLSGSWIF